MHTLLQSAIAAVMLLPAQPHAHTSSAFGEHSRQMTHQFVAELLDHRQELSLTQAQVDSLTTLAARVRTDHGQIRVTGLDRVPGKSVPRLARVYPARRMAIGLALGLLTHDQRLKAERLAGDRE